MHKSKRKWLCEDCKQNTSHMKEHYFVRTELLTLVHPSDVRANDICGTSASQGTQRTRRAIAGRGVAAAPG